MNCIIRPYTPTDRAFIADAWLNTLRAATVESRETDWDAFRTNSFKRIDGIIDDSTTTIRVAAPPDDEITLYGFIATGPKAIHMLFVKKPFRKQGIGRQLLAGLNMNDVVFTHWSRDFGEWIILKFQKPAGVDKHGRPRLIFKSGFKYNPYLDGAK